MDLSQVEVYNKEVAEQRAQRDKDYAEYEAAGRIWGLVPRERITKIKFPRVKKEIIDGYLSMDDMSTTVSDVLDGYGIDGAIPSSYLKPVIPGSKICGPAVTLRSIPIEKTTTQGLRDHDFIKMASREVNYLAEPGDVLVGDAGGMTEMSSMGGQSFVSAKIRGLEGVVIDGAVRDVGEIRKYGVPTWCRGATPKTGKCRIEAMEINGPVVLAGIQINPGDLIIADDSGICAVPPQHAAYVLKKCQEILPDEEVMRELIERDAPISEIKKLFRKRYTDDDNPNTQK